MPELGPIQRRIAARRAERDAEAAASGAPREHVVVVEGAGRPHSVALEHPPCLDCGAAMFHDDPPWCPPCLERRRQSRRSPFTRRALAGELPAKEVSL